jgi:tRNA-specific 2-thiouridylase
MYVLALRPADRQVIIGPKSALERTVVTASAVNWIIEEPGGGMRVTAQIRHRHHAAPAMARRLDGGRVEVTFDAPQLAVTPGQALVLYDGDTVVGGGGLMNFELRTSNFLNLPLQISLGVERRHAADLWPP